jgi:dipeptidase E
MPNNRILAFSSSRSGNSAYLQTAVPHIKNFLGDRPLNIAFIPFASVDNNYEAYTAIVQTVMSDLPHTIITVQPDNAKATIEQADVIMVGGGNTFKLLYYIYYLKLLDIIRDKVNNGSPYIGWSAGSNITCPGIGTTNDMPVIEPKSFNALGFFPFQINPHYINIKPEGHNGETRDQRLEEFMQMNPGIPIVALPEGTAIKLESSILTFIGEHPAVLFYWDENAVIIKREIMPGENLSFLL